MSWFSLFFIPVIPVRSRYFTVCPNCKNVMEVMKKGLDEAWRDQERRSQATSLQSSAPTLTGPAPRDLCSAPHPLQGSMGTERQPEGMPCHGMLPPAGWYADPGDASQLRFWDGTSWTSQVSGEKER